MFLNYCAAVKGFNESFLQVIQDIPDKGFLYHFRHLLGSLGEDHIAPEKAQTSPRP